MSLLRSCIDDIVYKHICTISGSIGCDCEITMTGEHYNDLIKDLEIFIKKHYKEKK